jgi:filamentous hemagglutinin
LTTEGRIASTADSVPSAMAMSADDAGRVGGVAAKPAVPPRVQSRINLQTGDLKKGWKHVLDRHFGSSKNASQFTITEEELRQLLQSRDVVGTPISRVVESAEGLRYVREVTLPKPVGLDKFSGFKPTSTMSVLTDAAGNLVTATPGVIK